MYPLIHTIEPFDSSVGAEIKFTWRGNQIYKVRCIVKNNETGITVYDHAVSTMKQSYTMPANSGLINGMYYVVYITVFDINNNESDLQEIGIPFYCLSKPLYNLSVSEGDVIQTSTYKIGINYSQEQKEPLDYYSVTLYSYQRTPISSSDDIYNTSDMSYVISGLENAKHYYLRATGKTLHGIALDTGYILITVSYTIAQVFNTLELNNNTESGAIEIKSNIVSAIGVSKKDVIYINSEYANLIENEVTFDEGFEVKGDFSKIFVLYEPLRNESIISFTDGDRLKVNIFYRIGSYSDSNGQKAYFELVANSCGVNYVMNSNYVDIPSAYQQFALLVNRQGPYYEMKVALISQHVRYSSSPNGSGMTETKQLNSQYVGIGNMPTEVYEHENLILNSTGNLGNISKWLGLNTPNMTLNIVDYALELTDIRPQPTPGRINVYQNPQIDRTTGKITLSFKYKADPSSNTTNGLGIGSLFRVDTVENPYVDIIKLPSNIIADNQWHEVSGTGDLSYMLNGKVINKVYLYIFTWQGTVVYKNIKLEHGDIATQWTPAPSDWLSDPTNYQWIPIQERR